MEENTSRTSSSSMSFMSSTSFTSFENKKPTRPIEGRPVTRPIETNFSPLLRQRLLHKKENSEMLSCYDKKSHITINDLDGFTVVTSYDQDHDNQEHDNQDNRPNDECFITFEDLKGKGIIGKDGKPELFTSTPERESQKFYLNENENENENNPKHIKRSDFSSDVAYQLAVRRYSKPKIKINKTKQKLKTSQRVLDLVEAYGIKGLDKKLVHSNEENRIIKRSLCDIINDELEQYRSEVLNETLARNDSETIGTSVRSGTLNLKELQEERLLMQRLGFVEHVYALDKKIEQLLNFQKQKFEIKKKEYNQRKINLLYLQQEQKMNDYKKELQRIYETTKEQCKKREALLVETHKRERSEFIERTIRTATCSDVSATVCSCKNNYTCPHNKTARYRLRKRNPMVIKYLNAARRLRKNKRVGEAMEFEEKANVHENEDKIKWTFEVQKSALDTKLPILMKKQERQSKMLHMKHTLMLQNQLFSNEVKMRNLKRVLDCERQKSLSKMSKLKASEIFDKNS